MPSISYSLSSFTKTNTDMAAGTTFTASASGATVTGASITSGTLYLSSIRTYSGVGYLDFSLGSGTGSTGTFSSNSATHSDTVSLSGYSNALLTAGSGTISFTLRRTTSGSGNVLNLRSGITGTLTLNYQLNSTACTAPTACSVSSTLAEGNVTLSWSGAAGGTSNAISSYEIQYSESSDNATWGAWTALTTVTTTTTSGSASVAPSSTRGYYRRFQVRTRGAAGASYYSGWKVSTNSVRRDTLPTAPTAVTATPAVYSTEAISLTWSGAVGGTSAIKGFTITSRTSTDNATWSAWTTLATLTQTAGSGTYAPTVSRVIGTYTQFGISTIDALNVSSAVKASASILCSITACGLPTAFSLSTTLTEGAVTLSWSGATHGAGNTITAYELQYSESTDASTWGAWTALTVVSSTATSGSQSVNPSSTAGTYRRFRLRIQGTAGETYYSAWLTSTNNVRRNIPPTAPTVFTAAPAVYDVGTIALAWSGIVAGTSAIKQVVIQQATSTDGVSWGTYAALTTITTTATSGTYEATPSSVSGMSTRYRLSATDTLNSISAYALSNVVRKVSPPTAPVVTAPKAAGQTYAATPRYLITTGTRLGGGTQKVCVKIGTADWEDSVANPERFSTGGYLANGVPTIYTPVALAPGNYTVTFRSVDSGSEAVSPEVMRSFTVLASPFEEIIANVTKVKAAHMRSLRTAINNVRDFYGMSTLSWSEDIISGKTYVKNWPFHVLELRKAIEQVVDAINAFDQAWTNKLPDPAWIPITTGRPQTAVMQQLQAIILGL
ncbi:MAG: hypothetical protein GX418_05135 [Clostridiales bacterium]|nr:hypothetical protein [Clostridiales bacterium]